jgi:glucose/arabinose dehydrogenase
LSVSVVITAVAAALQLTPIGEFRQPVYVTGPSSQPGSVYVLERGGRVWRVGPGGGRRLFLDARRYVRLREPRNQIRDQGGAFALAFPPRYRPGNRVYLLYTRRDGRVHLDAFRRGRPTTILSLRRTSRVDIAGDIGFGPDGLLYAGFGFGRRPEASQDPDTLAGKLVRLDPLAPEPQPELLASGLRVPWRISFDRRGRRLIVADVGEADFEEINVVPLGASRPLNFGWPFFEGRQRRLPGGPARATPPIHSVAHGRGICAIVGGHLLRGRYVYGDVCSGRVRSVRLGARRGRADRSERAVVPYLVSFGRDGGERLYAVSLLGRVYRVR